MAFIANGYEDVEMREGDIYIEFEDSFGDVLEVLTAHARQYIDETYTPQMIIEELSHYV